jgi:hypothetical protein
MPTELRIEPILPAYRSIVKEIMQSHGGGLDENTAFFPDTYEMLLVESRDGKSTLGFNPADLVCPCCHRSI